MLDDEPCRHVWRDVTDESEPPQRVVPMIGRWAGVTLMQIGGTYACKRCEVRVMIEAAEGGSAMVRWTDRTEVTA